MLFNDDKTIVAPSTPLIRSAISIIRLSGKSTSHILDRIFSGKKKPTESPRISIRGEVKDESGTTLDTAICIFYKAPNSYTGEDMAEICVHGNPLIVEEVIRLCVKYGANLAEKGEFSKRAYLNGKIDLAQAESVSKLIEAHTLKGIKASAKVLKGELSAKINEIKEKIISIIATIDASIDFPEYVDDEVKVDDIRKDIERIFQEMEKIRNGWCRTKISIEPPKISIVGKPNVGKSTLFNRIVGKERAIVTEIPGTTRDFIEEEISLKGMPLRIIDTAGLRTAKGLEKAETMGIEKTFKCIEESELILAVFDASQEKDENDDEVISATSNKDRILILNKCDIKSENTFRGLDLLKVSAKYGQGIDVLTDEVFKHLNNGSESDETSVITLRQKISVDKTLESLEQAMDFIKSSHYIGTEYSMRASLQSLSEITGDVPDEVIINEIFSKFCIGK